MPELPEVETTLQGIIPHLKQQRISEVVVRQFNLRWPIPADIAACLVGETIIELQRRGKYLLLHTQTGTLIIHLGMSGHLRILLEPTMPNRHDHVDILLHNQKTLRYTDPRRFGSLLWMIGNVHDHPLLKKLGVEPLSKDFSGKYLWSCSQNKVVPIKALLMDHHIVTGIGNIYATEALFAVGIHPALPAKTVSVARLTQLVKESKQILRQAIKRGGTTLKDFSDSNGKPGYFSNQLKVYGRHGQPCVQCQAPLHVMRIRQRSTVYCKHCQR